MNLNPAPVALEVRKKPSRLRAGLVGAVAAGVLIAAVAAIVTRNWPATGTMPAGGDPKELAGLPAWALEEPRKDFEVTVKMLGSTDGPAGERRLVEGRLIAFDIEVERDAYVVIWSFEPDGTVVRLFPNKHEQNHWFPAGNARIVPDPIKEYGIRAYRSKGMDLVRVVASSKPWDLPRGSEEGDYVFYRSEVERQQLEDDIRGLGVEALSGAAAASAIGEAVVRYRVEARKP